jgi:hypothetical protein
MYTFEVTDLTTNNSFHFDTATAFTLGRGDKFGIQDRTVSRKQGKIYYKLHDGQPPKDYVIHLHILLASLQYNSKH